MMKLFLVPVMLLVAFTWPADATGKLSGRRAPGFALADSSLHYHDLGDYRGKVVLLEIMQTKCPNCQKLSLTLERIQKTYAGKVAVLSVVVPPDNQTTVRAFVEKFGVTYPILFDCGQMTASYLMPSPAKPAIHVPHLFLIDGAGFIRNDFDHTSTAIFEGQGLKEEIDRLLQGADRPKPKR